MVSPCRAMSFIASVTFLPPTLTVILSRRRRISVYTAFKANGNKYHSAGRSLCMQRQKQSAANFWLGPACTFRFISRNRSTVISGLRPLPPIRLRRTSPPPGGRIGLSMLLRRDMWHTAQHPQCPFEEGWQRNWIRREAKQPENPVTCFPAGERWWRQPPKGALP